MAFFDHFAEAKSTRAGDFLSQRKTRKEFFFLTPHLPNKEIAILEIGPGLGDLAMLFMENGYKNYDIVEPNDGMREALLKHGVRKAKNYLIPLLTQENDDSYDLIIVSDVFEHLNDTKEAQLFVNEAYRVLKNDGLLFILSPDLKDWKEDFYNCDFSHSNPTTVRRTLQLFYNEGFKLVTYKYMYSCFSGFFGFIMNRMIKILTHFHMGNSQDSKPYKLKLTFLRRFLILGRKIL